MYSVYIPNVDGKNYIEKKKYILSNMEPKKKLKHFFQAN